MNAVEFKGFNVEFAKNQKEYKTLPAFHDKENGIVVTCYKFLRLLEYKELIKKKNVKETDENIWKIILYTKAPFTKRLNPPFVSSSRQSTIIHAPTGIAGIISCVLIYQNDLPQDCFSK